MPEPTELPSCNGFPAEGSLDFRNVSSDWDKQGFTGSRAVRTRPRRSWTALYKDVPFPMARVLVQRWENNGRGILPLTWVDPQGVSRSVEVLDMDIQDTREAHAHCTIRLRLQEVL